MAILVRKRAFVLGNGRSRIGLDLESLRQHGVIYGCNALYRDFAPDILVATDPGMRDEIEASGYPVDHEFYTRLPQHDFSKKIHINFGFSSGPIAVSLAAESGHKEIYLIGFDLAGHAGKFNNVYSGTQNYKPTGSDATYFGNWVNQIHQIARDYSNKKFFRVGNILHMPAEWERMHNIVPLSTDEFVSLINNVSWQKPNE